MIAAHVELGLCVRDVAVMFGEPRQNVSRIVRGDRWAHLRAGDPRDRRMSLSDEQIAKIRLLKLQGMKRGAIARMFGLAPNAVDKVTSYRSRAHIRPTIHP